MDASEHNDMSEFVESSDESSHMRHTRLSAEESERVAQIRDALVGEFTEAHSNPSRMQITKEAVKDLADLRPKFLNTLRDVIEDSHTSPALRARVAMWGYDKLLAQESANSKDPLNDFLSSLPAPNEPSTSTH